MWWSSKRHRYIKDQVICKKIDIKQAARTFKACSKNLLCFLFSNYIMSRYTNEIRVKWGYVHNFYIIIIMLVKY